MSKIFKDSRSLKDKLADLESWEVLFLNKIYETDLFLDVDTMFHSQTPDYKEIYHTI